jgi:hypothetical protein
MYGHRRRYREWPARPVRSRARRAARTRERFPRSPAARLLSSERLIVRSTVRWQTSADQDRPIIIAAHAFFPKGSLYEGAKYPKFSADTMNRRGLSACPKRSIMGTGGDALTLVLQTR